MRIKGGKESINYENTRDFFKRRARKYNADNPYSVTMYQDDNADLVRKRNQYETEKLIRLLDINQECNILDLACGVGRWADALADRVDKYTGIDFSEELIEIAKSRKSSSNVSLLTGSLTDLDTVLKVGQKFNRVLIIGILMYLNDEDVANAMEQVEKHCETNAYICIREPIGIESRLTLKDFYSDELEDNYNAIYRTREELVQMITPSLLKKGFIIAQEGFLFDGVNLNNRAETAQYFFILKR